MNDYASTVVSAVVGVYPHFRGAGCGYGRDAELDALGALSARVTSVCLPEGNDVTEYSRLAAMCERWCWQWLAMTYGFRCGW